MCFSCLLLAWDIATTNESRAIALWAVGVSNAGMIAVHVFAPLSLLPFLVAEGVRFRERRRPVLCALDSFAGSDSGHRLDIPLFANYKTLLFPPEFQASPLQMAFFFYRDILALGQGLCLAAIMAILVKTGSRIGCTEKHGGGPRTRRFLRPMAKPILLNLLLMPAHGEFWCRYCFTTTIAIPIIVTVFMARGLRFNRAAAWAASIALAYLLTAHNVVRPLVFGSIPMDTSSLARTRPDLPLVAGRALTFLEMDHTGRPVPCVPALFLARLGFGGTLRACNKVPKLRPAQELLSDPLERSNSMRASFRSTGSFLYLALTRIPRTGSCPNWLMMGQKSRSSAFTSYLTWINRFT